MSPVPPATRERFLRTGVGTNLDAFGVAEWGLLAFLASVWGSSFLLMAIGLEAFEPGVITLARVALGAATLSLFRRARRPVERADLPRVALLGVIMTAIPLTLFPIAQQWVDSSVAGMINGAMPLATAAWAIGMLRRLPGRRQLIGLLLGFAGVVSISLTGATQGADNAAVGIGLLILAITLYGLATNLVVPLQQRYGSLPVMLRAQTTALIVVLPYGLLQLPDSHWQWDAALAMVPLGVLGTGLAFVGMATLAGRVGGPRASVAIYFTPAVAILLGTQLRDEPVSALALVGTTLVVAGAWMTSRKER